MSKIKRTRKSEQAQHDQPGLIAQPVYPFTAIVGQEEMKLALILNVIDPLIGGVLIMGHRGTGKSTAVRALADLLPPILKVKNCPYGCDPNNPAWLCSDCVAKRRRGRLPVVSSAVPVVELPIGATEDRVCGTLNIERALTTGVRAFEPGLLAQANRGFLYIDEVNLLEDHLVDLLLDVAASGRNIVEREGISISHPARFVLVGSGNPEEGELRPQLLDRFGLHTHVETITDVDARVQIIQRREQFDQNPTNFRAQMESQQEQLRQQIIQAQQLVGSVTIDPVRLRQIAQLCLQLGIDGHRGELTIMRAAKALAAFDGRTSVSDEDIRAVAPMSLRHRFRKDPLGEIDPGMRIERALDDCFQGAPREKSQAPNPKFPPAENPKHEIPNPERFGFRDSDLEFPSKRASDFEIRMSDFPRRGLAKPSRRRRTSALSHQHGRVVGTEPTKPQAGQIALTATLRVAAPAQPLRRHSRQERRLRIAPADLRWKRFRHRAGLLIIFVLDASGSMAANRIHQAKAAVIRLLQQAYIHRDQVALISFRHQSADIMLPPTQSVERAKRLIDALPVGGSTPLGAGLLAALALAKRADRRGARPAMMVILTDGRANVSSSGQPDVWGELERISASFVRERIPALVINTQSRFSLTGEVSKLAAWLNARYIHLPQPTAQTISDSVTRMVESARQELSQVRGPWSVIRDPQPLQGKSEGPEIRNVSDFEIRTGNFP
ncbi:MAG: magnesium chelatase ATPase subunit I [Blastocatellia bacterium]|nr:magnesium chelatase ATPase subunit I [Blastocatellia bacterium]